MDMVALFVLLACFCLIGVTVFADSLSESRGNRVRFWLTEVVVVVGALIVLMSAVLAVYLALQL